MSRFTETDNAPSPTGKPTSRKQPKHALKKVPFRDRDFIAWDGEGTGDCYVLFGNSKGEDIAVTESGQRLRATECFRLIVDAAKRHPNHIHVSFAFNYDVTHLVRSLPDHRREQLVRKGYTWFNHYRLEYRPRKWFTVTDREQKISVRIFDMFSFFMCKATQAWAEYLPDVTVVQKVLDGKDSRDKFTFDQLPMIREYMHLELGLYVMLIERLRLLLAELDVHPQGWYGPGAVAGAVMRKMRIKHAMDRNLSDDIIRASQHAYFGGRFEQFHAGRYDGAVHVADIRSAYPHALRHLPNLADGMWQHREFPAEGRPSQVVDFSLYHVRYQKGTSNRELFTPSPLPYRDRRHCVHYPNTVEGWYWGIEINAAIDGLDEGDTLDILDAFEFIPFTDDRPFAFIEDLFEKRQQWKDEKNPVQLAAKLIMNSMYGKLAQRIGWNEKERKAPTWHQLEWAGFTTAYCRAMIYRAIVQAPHSIIAVETDGLFSVVPLDLPVDTKSLGDWESDQYDGIIYVQSGMYWLRCLCGGVRHAKCAANDGGDNSWSKVKIRGFGVGDITLSEVLGGLPTLQSLRGTTHRFAGITQYHSDSAVLGTWLDKNPLAVWGGGGKRHHNPDLCPKCLGVNVSMHPLAISAPHGGVSMRHVLPWRDDEINPWWGVNDGDNINAVELSAHRERIREEVAHRSFDTVHAVPLNAIGDATQ